MTELEMMAIEYSIENYSYIETVYDLKLKLVEAYLEGAKNAYLVGLEKENKDDE